MADNARILIADNHMVVRRGLRALIEACTPHEVVGEAADGRMALAMALEARPNIAIVDFAMPQLNGYELALSLKALLPELRILLFTMYDREELIMNAFAAGVRGFVLKSESEGHIIAAIEALASGRPYFGGLASEHLLATAISAADQPALDSLTPRERQITQLVAEGRINREIARMLEISPKTVESHRAAIMDKLHLHSVPELVRFAMRNEVIH